MKRYLGISPWRYGGWRNATNALTPEQAQAAMRAPVTVGGVQIPLETYQQDGKNEGRCMCFACTPYADGCEGGAEATAIGDEVTLELCRRCYDDHADAALAIAERAA